MTAHPPDPGLQPERTSLAWARTWAVVGADTALVARLMLENSAWWALGFALVAVVPLAALMRVQRVHERRVARFREAGEVSQLRSAENVGLVALVVGIAVIALITVLWPHVEELRHH